MRTNIHFVTKKGDFIMSLYHDEDPKDVFKVGDKLYFSFEDIFPRAEKNMRERLGNITDAVIDAHNLSNEKYGRNRYKIVSKYMSLEKTYNLDENFALTIEYTVRKCKKFYWKWWYIKSLFKINKKKVV